MQTVSEKLSHTPIVAIGASAGGLEALEKFFSQIPTDSGFAFVVVQHLSPQHTSVLAQLLGRNTQMPVGEVRDGTRAQADHVYVISPGTMLGIANGHFQVRPTDGDLCHRHRRRGDRRGAVGALSGRHRQCGLAAPARAVLHAESARVEQALKDSEARFRTLVELSSEVLYRMSPDWSEIRELESRGMLGLAEVTSRSWLESYILSEDRPQVKAVIDRAIRTKSVFELEHRVVRADGSPGWTWSRAVPLTDANGDIVEWFGAANDVTARKRVELELADANRRLLDTDRRKNEFLAVLSHELRNPLAPIRNCLDVLDRAPPESDMARRAHEVIHRQFDHLTHLVDDLLDVTRITSGKIALQREVLDLNELSRRTVEDHRDAFVRGGIELAFAAAPAAVHVNADRTRLAQVIGNLLQNAAKFTPSGGKTTVSIESNPTPAQALLRVSDTGRGIASEILLHLFEPFPQADTALDRQKGGLGLGLAVAKGLVELHGGAITAASDGTGKGASFTITLPRETSVPPPEVRKALRMLVIDDNADAADALRGVLELAGHQTDVAYNGPDGLQRTRAFAPHVVFCDIGLPEMDGYEVARTLRADPELGRTALVAVSGYGTSDDVAKARAAGFDMHVTKPLGMDRLEQVLAELETAPVRR
jgi:PAS domain S-box-containing protein